MLGSYWEALRMSRSGGEALLDVQEWSGGTPASPGVVRRSSLMYGSGQVALPDFWAWSGCPPRYPKVVGWPFRLSRRPSRMSGSGREALLDVRE